MAKKPTNSEDGKRPYTSDDYQTMLDRVSNFEVWQKKVERHSEFEKPYNMDDEDDYIDMQTIHPSEFDMSYRPPTTSDAPVIEERDCDTVWDDCLQLVCGNTTGCGGAGVVQQMRDCAGDCSKPHTDILECLHFNSLCYCIACHSAINPFLFSYFDCNQPMDEGCQQIVCDNPESCPSFTLEGGDTAPTTICPSPRICVMNVDGGNVAGDCIDVPDQGCGMKTVTVTDICGNTQTKQVRMSSGVWVLVSSQGYLCSAAICNIVDGDTKTTYHHLFGCCGLKSHSPGGGCGYCSAVYCGGAPIIGTAPCCSLTVPCPPPCGSSCESCCGYVGLAVYNWQCP